MTYALGHEKELFDRSIRRRVVLHRASSPASERARTTEDPRHPRDSRCDLLRPEERLPLATIASGLPVLGDRLLVVWEVARGRHLRAAQRRPARAAAGPSGQEPATYSAGIADSQSAKTTGVGGEQRGYDGNKKVRGSKRHLLVDTEGLVLKALPYTAPRCPTRRTG